MIDVIVLDGRDVPAPEDTAMLQALYSRSPKSVREHLESVKARGSGKFMEQFYVNYGHKSIADCGTTTIFIEGVSLLAAKAIQDWPLYNGQEASTRYLDMTQQTCVNSTGTERGQKLLDMCMEFYSSLMPRLIASLEESYPRKDNEAESVWKKAIKARAFDIGRGFLPAGVTTNLSWHTNLRQAADHIKQLRHHPLQEVKDIANNLEQALKEKYPSSFLHKRYEAEESYLELCSETTYSEWTTADFAGVDMTEPDRIDFYADLLNNRPAKAELPHRVRMAGEVYFEFSLDFGSYRDLQRHRGCVQEMPIHCTTDGFNQWYLSQLPFQLHVEAVDFLASFEDELDELDDELSDGSYSRYPQWAEDQQYYVPLGYNVGVTVKSHLPAIVYLVELRSSQHVHPTLRHRAQQMGQWLKERFPGMALHHDMSEDAWTIERGNQDITVKDEAL